MATLRDIKRRISSVNNTRQITSAMRAVSAAKLNRAQANVQAAQPFAERLRAMVTNLSAGLTAEDHPLFEVREGGTSVILHFTSDRGLCGAFNGQLNRRVFNFLNSADEVPEPELILFGQKGLDFFRRRGVTIRDSHTHLPLVEKEAAIVEAMETLVEAFREGTVNRVFLAYNHFYNPMTQRPVVLPLLPITPPEQEEGDGAQATEAEQDDREAIFEPSQQAILDTLLPRYLQNMGHIASLNTEAGEHGARMVAMEGATKNASEMIDRLTLQYNRARQAAITKELIEIVNGAQSL